MKSLKIHDAWAVLMGRKEAVEPNAEESSKEKELAEVKNKIKPLGQIALVLVVFIILLALVGVTPFIARWYACSFLGKDISNLSESGPFGDSFGFANALISALAFAGLIITMLLQRKSLEVQQEELRNNTLELKAQRVEFETQNKTMKLQRFENTFFNMLSLQQEIVNGLKYSYNKYPGSISKTILNKTPLININLSGREVFEIIYNRELQETIYEHGISSFKMISGSSLLDHYFLHIYRIIKFVDETSLLESKHEKYSYISILRATLSRYEIIFLFYNELNPKFSHFKELIEEYSLFDNLDECSLIQTHDEIPSEIKKYYDDSAYDPSIKGYNKLPINNDDTFIGKI